MDPKLLTPPSPGPNVSQPKPPHTSSDILDGFKFDWAPKNPAGEPTRPKRISNPPPVELQEPRLDLTARADHKDPDHVFVQTLPHIFQRKQGGWNAKLPEVDLNDGQTMLSSAQLSLEESQPQNKSVQVKQRGEDSMYMALRLTWTTKRTSGKRVLGFMVAETNNPTYDAEVQSSGAQASTMQNENSQKHRNQSDQVGNGTAYSNDIHNGEALSLNRFPVHDEPLELGIPRRVLWQ